MHAVTMAATPGPADSRSARSSAWTRRLLPAATVVAVLLAAYSALTADRSSTVTFVVVALVLLWALLRGRRVADADVASGRARAEWDTARVRSVAAGAGVDLDARRVAAVRALRRADRRLTLRDAVELVEAAAGPSGR